MTTATVTARGQVTLRKEVLVHLGLQPGQQMLVEMLPGGRVALSAAPPSGTIADFIGLLAGEASHAATLEEIESAIADGWAGRR
jgi:bifunctional DNA-binding transcriptional regulator/antitoxin component of YhaV-PrlF toxin-antitoxin module